MSGLGSPGGPRRRRIAGERRDRANEPTQGPEPADQVEPAQPPGPAQPAAAPPPQPTLPPPSPTEGVSLALPPAPDRQAPSVRPSASRFWLVAMGVLLVALVAATAWLGLAKWDYREVREQDQIAKAERSAQATAERAAPALLAYDYRTLDEDLTAAQPFMTTEFGEKFTSTFEGLVRANAVQLESQVTAEVLAAGVVHGAPTRVKVLLFVDQVTVSAANKTPQTALNRVTFDMVKSGDSWLVSDITSY